MYEPRTLPQERQALIIALERIANALEDMLILQLKTSPHPYYGKGKVEILEQFRQSLQKGKTTP